ncbi:MAG: 50S ribosomal protein L25 [Planctomycetota bacterium]|nr:50S ribosomal protein L25 [Planctomycetota bacterium]MDA1106026.1 50S ribosomal protein L25 [Planctomycetota bacterium]
MSHKTPSIEAALRERIGTRYARRVRQTGQLPAVIYGHGTAPTSVSVNEKQIVTALKQNQHVVELAIAGGATETCLVKELQFGFLGDNLIHVDFTRVNLDERVTVKVHLHWYGTPELAKKPGHVLTHDQSEIEVTCKVSDIPSELRVDLGKVMHSHNLHASDITLPAGVSITHPKLIIARVEEIFDAAPAEAAAPGTGAEPEVIKAKKPEDGAAATDAKEAKK